MTLTEEVKKLRQENTALKIINTELEHKLTIVKDFANLIRDLSEEDIETV